MRVLGWTNAPFVPSGYGIQIREICRRLMEAGHMVAVAANYGLGGAKLNWNGVIVYPVREGQQNINMIDAYAADFAADVVLSLYDVWPCPRTHGNLSANRGSRSRRLTGRR